MGKCRIHVFSTNSSNICEREKSELKLNNISGQSCNFCETAKDVEIYQYLGKRIRDAHLVAFPTETVYGLGGNAFDKESILKIFNVKNRPLSDPVITHVIDMDYAINNLYDVRSDHEKKLLLHLANKFWPGPLSIISRAKSSIPLELTAFTGYVAVRCPADTHAMNLIKYADRPIAAPSANKFGHISPTKAVHVLEEFPDEDLDIIDGGSCNVGIESTVIQLLTENDFEQIYRSKLNQDNQSGNRITKICIHRRGFLTEKDLLDCLKNNQEENECFSEIELFVVSKKGNLQDHSVRHKLNENNEECCLSHEESFPNMKTSEALNNQHQSNNSNNSSNLEKDQGSIKHGREISLKNPLDTFPNVSPGNFSKHYAPYVDTYLLKELHINLPQNTSDGESISILREYLCLNNDHKDDFDLHSINLNDCILFEVLKDLFNRGKSYYKFFSHFTLGEKDSVNDYENVEKICNRLFGCLREAESHAMKNSKIILIHDFNCNDFPRSEILAAVYDRISRASSGKVAYALFNPKVDNNLKIILTNPKFK